MAFELHDHDVILLQQLAASAGLGSEHVSALQRRARLPPEAREGAPYVLLFGSGNAIRQLLTPVAGAELANKVHASTAPVIVIGRRPQLVRPLVVAWPNIETDRLNIDGLLILKATDRVPEATLAALASLGTVELGILVSRLSQPLNQDERGLARAVVGIVEAVRVAWVGHPAEEVSAGEAGELADFARTQMGDAGFGVARFDGALLWRGGERSGGLPCEVASPGELLAFDPNALGGQRDTALATSLGRLLDSIDERLATAPAPVGLPATEQDIERLISQFDGHLAALGKLLRELVEDEEIPTSEQARAYLVDKVQGWISGQNLAAATLTLAEKFRPGVKALLASTVQAAAADLAVEPRPRRPRARLPSDEIQAAIAFLARYRWARVVAAAGSGAVTVFLGMIVLPLLGVEAWVSRLGAIALGLLLGLTAYFVMEQPWIIGQGSRPRQPAQPTAASSLKGWPVVAARLVAAFGAHLRNESGNATKQSIAELRERLVKGRIGA